MRKLASEVADLEAEVLQYRRRDALCDAYQAYEMPQDDNTIHYLVIYNDMAPSNPRDDDNLWTLIFSHKAPVRGDKPDKTDQVMGRTFREIRDTGGYVVPVYHHTHGNTVLSLSSFSDRWDSGMIGHAVVTGEKLKDELGNLEASGIESRIMKVLGGEIESYNTFIAGDIYGYRVYDDEWCEMCACWGFYGDSFSANGLFDNVGKDSKKFKKFL